MQTYDYRCLKCRHKFIVRMTMADHEKRKIHCPQCGSRQVRQCVEPFYAVTAKKS